jgi:hypothetical protein
MQLKEHAVLSREPGLRNSTDFLSRSDNLIICCASHVVSYTYSTTAQYFGHFGWSFFNWPLISLKKKILVSNRKLVKYYRVGKIVCVSGTKVQALMSA